MLLTYGDVKKGLERGDKFIPIQIVTKKNHTTAKTFLGEEAIEALKEYLEERRKGSQKKYSRHDPEDQRNSENRLHSP